MLISCITFTNGCSNWQIEQSIDSYYNQSYELKQLIIINNYNSLEQCLQFKPLFHKELCIIDMPGMSNAKALIKAASLASGQLIAHYPLDYYHNKNRLSLSYNQLINYNADLITPPGYKIVNEIGIITEFIHQTYTVGELCVYKRPAFRHELDIDYGIWWQYLLLSHNHGQEIVSIENTDLALKIPYNQPQNFNINSYKWA